MRIGIRMRMRIGIGNILTPPILLSLSFSFLLSLSLHSTFIFTFILILILIPILMLTPVANASNTQNALPEYSLEPQHSLYRKVRNYGTVVCSAVADPAGAMAKIVAAFDV